MKRPYRYDPEKAEAILRRLLPGASYTAFARIFADACQAAHTRAPSSWEVTLEPDMIRLNVGPAAVLDVSAGTVFLCVTPLASPLAPPFYYHDKDKALYPSLRVPSAGVECHPRALTRLDPQVLNAHIELVGLAANCRSLSTWHSAHSPAAVTVLGEAAQASIAQPAYCHGKVNASEDDSDAYQALDELFRSKEVEQAAVRLVTASLIQDGWTVKSVEKDGVGYDLECRQRRMILHVEVKGRSADGNVVILTAKEWGRALKDPAFRLAVVAYACSPHARFELLTGHELLKRCDVEPIAFRARLREPAG
jgi:hypothetical protein